MYNPISTRPGATQYILGWISSGRCWHLDVWLYGDLHGNMWVRALTTAGGRQPIGEVWFWLNKDTQFSIWQLTRCLSPDANTVLNELHLGAPHVLKELGSEWHARDMFWRLLAPMGDLWDQRVFPRRSLAFHMVKPVGVNDPCEGINNLYSQTGRAVRDEALGAKMRGRGKLDFGGL